jgi:hypothetical protein
MSDFDKFFIGANLGINAQTIDGGKAEPKEGGFLGLTIALQAGYRVLFPKNFYIEPVMSYVLSKSGGSSSGGGSDDFLGGLFGDLFDDVMDSAMASMSAPVVPLGWQGGLRIGVTF